MKYGIGVDIGITSIGWATVHLDDDERPFRFGKMGTRIFDLAENPKDGESLAAPRREARGGRRRLRRHRHRIERIRQFMLNRELLAPEELEELFKPPLTDIYALRVKALDTLVSNAELARILIHLAQRRGFKSNRKVDREDKEQGALITAVADNAAAMKANGYRTVGEMLHKDDRFLHYKRNKGENYLNTVSRDMVADEAAMIFTAQRAFGNAFATEENEKSYLDILTAQRSFEAGPGGNSPYGGNQIEKMIGKCVFEANEPRAPKAAYSSEYCTLLQNINHLRIVSKGTSRALTPAETKSVVELAHASETLSFAKLRKLLALCDDELFSALTYGSKEIAEVEKAKFEYMKAYHKMRKVLDKIDKGYILTLSVAQRNAIGYIFTVYKTDSTITAALKEQGFDDIVIAELLNLKPFSKFGRLSACACDKLIPYLEQGQRYNDACASAGYDFKGHGNDEKQFTLPAVADELEMITNPVVRRAISQTIKVINGIVREYGESPSYLSVELTRELSKDHNERAEDEKSMKENQARNARLMERIRNEFKIANASGIDLIKLKLWEEQDGVCPYSQKHIAIEKLFTAGYAEIDHIIPYSLSFDDSYKNKVLVLTEENRQKGNRLPMQYLTGKARENFVVWVNSSVRNYRKKQLLLKERITEEDEKNFIERNLNDTKYISRFVYNYINDHLAFAESAIGRKKRVSAVNGAVTAYMRKRWGISKIREDGDLHHCIDAAVIACTTDAMIKRVSEYSRRRELEYVRNESLQADEVVDRRTGEAIKNFPLPWPDFRRELDIRTSDMPSYYLQKTPLAAYTPAEAAAAKPIFVSRMPKHKVTGAAHLDTIKSPRLLEDGYVLVKRPLTALRLGKDGEIDGYYNPQSDRLLYEALKARLHQFNGNAESAFAESFYKPTAAGAPGPLVKKVKLMEKSTLAVPVHSGNGVASNGGMVRIDVFHIEGDGYYWVPVYIADTVKDTLPNKAVIQGKSYSEWKEMKDEDFVFSLYSNDLIHITTKKEVSFRLLNAASTLPKEFTTKDFFAYFISGGIAVASITVINHDKTYAIASLGVKTLVSLEKYQVDVLGNYYRCGKEKRQRFR